MSTLLILTVFVEGGIPSTSEPICPSALNVSVEANILFPLVGPDIRDITKRSVNKVKDIFIRSANENKFISAILPPPLFNKYLVQYTKWPYLIYY